MDHYIVRIYRQEQQRSGQLVGIVEDVASGNIRTFHTINELEALLGARPRQVTKAKFPIRSRKGDIEPKE